MSAVNELEEQLSNAKMLIARRDTVLKLSENPDFRKIIREEFMTNECARYAQLSADPALKPEERADALAISQAAGHLKRYLNVIIRMGNAAENEKLQIEEAIDEARAEEDNN